ncbi:MAG: DUF72 domain-containing protein [Deltaproteobacteria bacterium]|nr:DUF72 domain-containing protein [Deltaproteobacteria bacterium]
MDVKVGCCGFPKARSEYYAHFQVVEVQQTFYQPPTCRTAERWRSEAPSDFEFTLKAWQLITHESRSPTYRRLKLPWPQKQLNNCGSFQPTEEVHWAWEQTREVAMALKAKIIVFQTPASFQPTPENKENLRKFFRAVDRTGFLFIWEPRGLWRNEEVHERCRELNLTHGVDPFKTDPLFGQVQYFRIHGITGYGYRFSEKDLRALKEKCLRKSYCLFNNVSMWMDALAFQRLIGEKAKPPKIIPDRSESKGG